MAAVVFPIASTPIPGGTTRSAWNNITSLVAAHPNGYEIGINVTAWALTDEVAVQIEFRIDNGAIVPGCRLTTTGGVHHAIDGSVINPHCGSPGFPEFTSRLDARAVITVPSPGSVSGSITLI